MFGDAINDFFAWWHGHLLHVARKCLSRDIIVRRVSESPAQNAPWTSYWTPMKTVASSGNKFELIPEEKHANWLFLMLFFGVDRGDEWIEVRRWERLLDSHDIIIRKQTKFTCRLSSRCSKLSVHFLVLAASSLSDFNFVFGVKNFNTRKKRQTWR